MRDSTIEHITQYQIERGDMALNENVVMKYFLSSLRKKMFLLDLQVYHQIQFITRINLNEFSLRNFLDKKIK